MAGSRHNQERGGESIDPHSPIGVLLIATMSVLRFCEEDGSRTPSRVLVERIWGSVPQMERRQKIAKVPAAILQITGVVFGLLMILTVVIGIEAQSELIEGLAMVPASMAALALGLSLPLAFRGNWAKVDFEKWREAGQPPEWVPGSRSRPRNRDLIWGSLFGLLLAYILAGAIFG